MYLPTVPFTFLLLFLVIDMKSVILTVSLQSWSTNFIYNRHQMISFRSTQISLSLVIVVALPFISSIMNGRNRFRERWKIVRLTIIINVLSTGIVIIVLIIVVLRNTGISFMICIHDPSQEDNNLYYCCSQYHHHASLHPKNEQGT